MTGVPAEERQGRHRYVRLADARIAQLVEVLAAQVAPGAVARRAGGPREAGAGSATARGRTRYDHLAGRLGITLTDALTARGLLWAASGSKESAGAGSSAAPAPGGRARARPGTGRRGPEATSDERNGGFALTEAGLRRFGETGIALDRTGRRPPARACLERTERRPHLAGAASAALCRHARDTGWRVRIARSGR
ncbi:hypothetical protein [Streptomyces sp. NPDC047706]|uniref:hypothetical protein n=1 Tax=Streptomyces sp. NPDC047706 TaxID=3365486 RepID=UPI00371CF445